MICKKILGHLHHEERHALIESGKSVETIEIDWFERDKKILRKTTSSGEEVGINLEENSHSLNEGDLLYEDEKKVIVIKIADTDLLLIKIHNIKEMGRCCFELGNRHLSLLIEEDKVLCPFDQPTFEYMKHKGFDAEKIFGSFSGYTECKGHHH